MNIPADSHVEFRYVFRLIDMGNVWLQGKKETTQGVDKSTFWRVNTSCSPIFNLQISRDAEGVLGETMVATKDANGKPIMTGMEAIIGQEEDCEFSDKQGSNGLIILYLMRPARCTVRCFPT